MFQTTNFLLSYQNQSNSGYHQPPVLYFVTVVSRKLITYDVGELDPALRTKTIVAPR